MKADAEFDAYLTQQLDAAPLADRAFTDRLAARLRRHRRRRRLAFAAALAVAGVTTAIAVRLSSLPVLAPRAITPQTIVATLVLVSVCSLVWIDTEPGPPRRRG